MFLFFFFQAEDGIRDLYVTGVQTCALPISWSRPSASNRPAACRPPVVEKTDWPSRSLPGSAKRSSGEIRRLETRSGASEGITFSIEVFPQTPQAEPITVPRSSFSLRL